MTQNKEKIKNKIFYRSSYRGTKEMDILMINFVKSIINDLDYDELLKSLKNKDSKMSIDSKLNFILEKFQNY